MKCFKKLLAAALAGVLALTLLVGCSSEFPFNKSEYIKQVGDYIGVTYQDIGDKQASAFEAALRKGLSENLFSPNDTLWWKTLELCHSRSESDTLYPVYQEFCETLGITEDTHDFYFVSVAVLDDFSSTQFKDHLEAELARSTFSDQFDLSLTGYYRNMSNQGTVSLKVVTLEGKQYLLGVWMIAE